MMRDIRVLSEIGSDHFPVYGCFQYHPCVEVAQPEPEVEETDHELAQEKLLRQSQRKR